MSTMPSEANLCAALNAYIYLDDTGAKDGESIDEIISRLENDPRNVKDSEFEENLQIIKNARKGNDYLGKMTISGQSCHMDGYEHVYACVFSDENGNAYMSFRGTGDGRWVDNGIAFGAEDSPVQKLAKEYFDKVCELEGWNENTNLVVTGHSKGGNLAQYITMCAANRGIIDKCISMDGQGFSREAIERFKKLKGYDEQIDKLWDVCGENDPVNHLGYKIIPPEHNNYVDQSHINSINPFEYHILGNMLGEDGKIRTKKDTYGWVGEEFKELSDIIMKYPAREREELSKGIMETIEFIFGNFDFSKHTAFADPIDFQTALQLGVPSAVIFLLLDASSDLLVENNLRKIGADRTANAIDAISSIMITAFCYDMALKYYAIETFETWCFQKIEQLKAFVEAMIETGGEIAGLLSQMLSEAYSFAVDAINAFSSWLNEHFNYGYKTAQSNPAIMIDTGKFQMLGDRMEALYDKVRRIENLLDNVYWYNISLSLNEYHAVGNANRNVGSLSKMQQCASYFYKTAEEFNALEDKLK